MEQEPSENLIPTRQYRVLFHHKIQDDFSHIPPDLVQNIIEAAEHRLGTMPQMGTPLRSFKPLWKLPYSKYRVVYIMNNDAREVWVLSVQKRDEVYHEQHLVGLVQLAMTMRQNWRK